LQRWRHEILFPQRFIERDSRILILGRQGTATDQVAGSATLRVPGDAFPKHVQYVAVAILLMDASSPEFQDFAAHRFEPAEIEELLTVVAQIALGAITALHTIRPSQFPRGCVMHHQVVAGKIEMVAVEATQGRAVQPFPKLAIENQIAQALAFDDIVERLRHPDTEEVGFGKWISALMYEDSGRWHASSFK
jgi:hypothetical protein